MKRRELKKARVKSIEELKAQVENVYKELSELKMQLSLGELKNTSLIKIKKKDIAQLLTIIKEKELKNNG
jgi:large subunit ribosomal protein L29